MAEASEIQSVTDDDQSDVDALCVRTLFERLRPAAAMAPLGTIFLGWYEKNSVDLSLLIGWVVLNTLSQAVTFWTSTRVLRHPPQIERLRYWRNWQTFWSGLEGMCWGSAAIFFHAPGSVGLLNDAVVMTVIIIMACLSIFPFAPSFQTFTSFISGALLIPVAHYFWSGDIQNAPYVIGILMLLSSLADDRSCCGEATCPTHLHPVEGCAAGRSACDA